MNRKVIYTAIFGDYDGLIPQASIPGFDFVCFTDNPNLSAKPWVCKQIELPPNLDNTRKNRYLKLLPHRVFPEYDISIYIDANYLITQDLNPLVQKYLNDYNMACFDHNQTTADPRNCIYKEYDAILTLGKDGNYKDNPEAMLNQINMFKVEGYPENYGLIKGSFLMRKHKEEDVKACMEDWWNVVLNQSKRDQLSFNYVAWKHKFNYAIIPNDIRKGNPYIYFLGNHRKNWKAKLWAFKIKSLFRKF